jgi:hypothetical protein
MSEDGPEIRIITWSVLALTGQLVELIQVCCSMIQNL